MSHDQQAQVERFCQVYNDSKRDRKIPGHLMLYDDAKTAFCFVPKVGCTTLKVIFFTAQGIVYLKFTSGIHVHAQISSY